VSEGRIVVVGPNPALEVNYFCESVSLSAQNDAEIRVVPGGKGTNVVRVLKALGADPILITCLGGIFGEFIRHKLTDAGVDYFFVEHTHDVRLSTVIYEKGKSEATIVRTDGDVLSAAIQFQFVKLVSEHVVGQRIVCVAGSLPKGFSYSVTEAICQLVKNQSCRAIVDVAGGSLLSALKASPFLVKGNLSEFCKSMGQDTSDSLAPQRLLEMLRASGAENAIITLGKYGWVAHIEGVRLKCQIDANLEGFDIGAGDAMTAGLAHALNVGYRWKEALQFATKVAAASTYCQSAGEVAVEKIGSAPACNIETY
jgi:tagatose 6-phosphate kinase